jgi:hypothetical protein
MLFLRQSRTKQELQKHILGVINRTDSSLPKLDDRRGDRRFLRAVPVVLAPWTRSRPEPEEHAYAVTRDMSLGGMGLILQQPFKADDVVVAIRPTPLQSDEPLRSPQFFVGSVHNNTAIGGGFWLVSVVLAETVTPDDSLEFRRFQEYAMRLAPPVVDTKLMQAVRC